MSARLGHRGPDDSGTWTDRSAGLALGHRRLSILDLSAQGHQPMFSSDGRFAVILNGEIYNFLDIRLDLEKSGAAPDWRGHSDTEVLLAAISHWGLESSLKRFFGMFAFALWDREDRLLHLVRDRIGEKPLYYGWAQGVFLFGSELKALRVHPCWQGEIDRNSLALFLRHNYVPAPYSIHKSVFKVVPGTIVSVQPDTLDRYSRTSPLPFRSFWSASDTAREGTTDPLKLSTEETVDRLESLLKASVKRQMISDVPLGAFLSGGIDSSTIVALMQAQSDRPVKTFSIGFHEDEFNEAQYAKAVAVHLGTDHTQLYVTPEEARAVIPLLPQLYDEPFSDSSQIPTFLVSRLARSDVTVSLSGDGGDELFGGYNRYFWGKRIWRKLRLVPSPFRVLMARSLTLLAPESWQQLFAVADPVLPARFRQVQPGDKVHKLAEVLSVKNPEEFYRALVSHWKSPESVVLESREPATPLTNRDARPDLPSFEQLMMFLDLVTYLPDDILVKVDRAAMGVSLETRVPFLDPRVVEFSWTIPLSMKIREGRGKWILRKLLDRYVPGHLVERPKMGFGVPIGQWLRGPLRDWAEELLDEARIRREGFFDPIPIRRRWKEHLGGGRNFQYHLWDVLMFQAWLEATESP